MEIIVGSVCCGLVLGGLIITFLIIRKIRGANSNYTEFELNEYNHPMTWKDNNNYE